MDPLPAKESSTKLYEFITKLIGASAGGVGVCSVVSYVGVAADGLQVAASFVFGPNLITVVTLPISVGCKIFGWACKKSKLP